MHIIGFLRMLLFLSLWIFGAACVPLALGLAYFGSYLLMYIVVAYYSVRFVWRARFWPRWKSIMRMNEPGRTYCNSHNVVFEKGASAPVPGSKNMLCVAPHGILTVGFSCLVSSVEFEASETRWLVTDALLVLPFIRDVMIWSGISGCNASTFKKYLQRGLNVGLIPGGFQEATLFQRGHHRVFLKSRKGFIKYALQYGYQVQPAYMFGEEWTYWQYAPKFLDGLRFWLNKYNIPATFFMGKWLFILPDNDLDLTMVIGKPLVLPHIRDPTAKQVDEWHSKYTAALKGVFDRNKAQYCCKGDGKKMELELF